MHPNGRAFCLRELSARKDIDLHAMAWVEMQNAEMLISTLLQGNTATIMMAPDPHQDKSLRLDAALSMLNREVGQVREESGQYPLHICYPFVYGKFQDGTPFRGPLFLIPVRMIHHPGASPRWVLQPLDTQNGYWNHVFLHALELHQGIELPKDLPHTWPDDIQNISHLHQWIHEVVKKYLLPIFVDQGLFAHNIPPFRPIISASLEALPAGRLDVIKEGTLSLLPVADSSLFHDYEKLIHASDEHLEFLQSQKNNPVIDIPESERFWISGVDEYQEEALLSLHAGNNVLLHGPPGTGKTQVIRNAIAQALANGKTVLVVSQKRAALEVLYERLILDGLGTYCALIHDAGADRNLIYSSIRKQIEDLEYTRLHHDQGYLSRLEKAFKEDGNLADEQFTWFEQLADALSSVQDHGYSVHEMYLGRKTGTWNLLNSPDGWTRSALRQFEEALHLFWPLRGSGFPFLNIFPNTPWKNLNVPDVRLWITDIKQVGERIRGFLDHIAFRNSERLFTTNHRYLKAGTMLLEHESHLLKDEHIAALWNHTEETCEEILAEARDLETLLAKDGFLSEMARHTLPVWEQCVHSFRALSTQHWFSLEYWRAWRMLNGYLTSIRWFDRRRIWAEREKSVSSVLSRIHRILQETGDTQREHRPGDILQALIQKIILAQKLHAAAMHCRIQETNPGKLLEAIRERKDILDKFYVLVENLTAIATLPFHPQNLEDLRTILEVLQPVCAIRMVDPETILEAGCCLDSLPSEGRKLLVQHPELLQLSDAHAVVEQVRQCLFSFWITLAEEQHPALTSLGQPTVELRRENLTNRIYRLRDTARLVVKHRIEGRILENIQYNRQRNRVTFRELYHQISKRRNIWPVRKLVSEFWKHDLSLLRPCWFMSPEAVAAIFPMARALFDLVILDEASQCFAEAAIPVLWRGKQFLVAGDEHQLKPSLLYKTRIESNNWDEEDEIQLAESAIDLVRPSAVSHYLRWHYRSSDEALIAFSNQHFYDGRLLSFPNAEKKNNERLFSWHSIRGTWKNNMNIAEAEAITDRIMDEYQAGTNASYAVVTFNYHQQNLIQDLLYEKILQSPASDGLRRLQTELENPGTHGLIIKNIENIQGDERDIILYSIGYGPDGAGQFASRFGTLSQQGGANRLNVAITRARRRIEVYCSFDPSSMRIGENPMPGPKLFKAWLQYVLDQSQGLVQNSGISFTGAENALSNVLLQRYPGLKREAIAGFGNSRLRIPLAIPSRGLAIDCEGSDYFEAKGARAREIYRPAMLQSRGWKYLRIWSRRPEHPELMPFA